MIYVKQVTKCLYKNTGRHHVSSLTGTMFTHKNLVARPQFGMSNISSSRSSQR